MTDRTNDIRQDGPGEALDGKTGGNTHAIGAKATAGPDGMAATGGEGPGQAEPPAQALPAEAAIPNPLALHTPGKKTGLINPVVLAYMGDAVFELLVRQYLISLPNNKSHHLHSEATKRVSAKAQRLSLERLQPLLTEEEADIVRRGRNTKSGAPPRNADPADYRHATALECLFGHLYFEGRMERIGELMRVALEERE